MRLIRYDLEKFHKQMEQNGNTLIIAPRSSGKTFALVRKFVEIRGSALMVPSGRMRRTVDSLLVELGCPDRRRDVYIMAESTIRGRRANQIFVDEIDAYDGNLEDLWHSVAPALNESGRIVAVSTPTGRRQYSVYQNLFDNIFDMVDDRWTKTVTQGYIIPKEDEYFDKELFEI